MNKTSLHWNGGHFVYYDNGSTELVDEDYYNYTLHDSFLNNPDRNTAGFGIFLTIWTFTINNLLAYCCVKAVKSTDEGFYLHVLNFTVSNILVSLLVFPLTVYYLLYPWNLGQFVCKIWIILDVLLPFATILIIIFLNLNRALVMTYVDLKNVQSAKSMLQMVAMSTPWFLAAAIVVPIWTLGSIPHIPTPGVCIVLISTQAAIVIPVLTYFVPIVALIILTLVVLILKWKFDSFIEKIGWSDRYSMKIVTRTNDNVTNSKDIEETTPLTERRCDNGETNDTKFAEPDVNVAFHDNKRNESEDGLPIVDEQQPEKIKMISKSGSVLAVCLVNFFFGAMWFSFQCVSLLLPMCNYQVCVPSTQLTHVVTWTGAASSGVVPLFWFVDNNIRNSLKSIWNIKSDECIEEPTDKNDVTFV